MPVGVSAHGILERPTCAVPPITGLLTGKWIMPRRSKPAIPPEPTATGPARSGHRSSAHGLVRHPDASRPGHQVVIRADPVRLAVYCAPAHTRLESQGQIPRRAAHMSRPSRQEQIWNGQMTWRRKLGNSMLRVLQRAVRSIFAGPRSAPSDSDDARNSSKGDAGCCLEASTAPLRDAPS
jgi:hypothetical protein